MKRLLSAFPVAMVLALLCAAPAMAQFGLNGFDVAFSNEDGSPATQAGSHPFAMDTMFELNRTAGTPDGEIKDDVFEQVEGFVGDATAIPRCSTADFLFAVGNFVDCPPATQVGQVAVSYYFPGNWASVPIFILAPPPGAAVRLGFAVVNVHIVIDVGVKQVPDYNVVGSQSNIPQVVSVFGAKLRLWGNPADAAHDHFRFVPGDPACGGGSVSPSTGAAVTEIEFVPQAKACPLGIEDPKPFLTLPRSCTGPALSAYRVASWQNPTVWDEGSSLTHDFDTPPNPQGFTGCGKLGFAPGITSAPTTDKAETPTGLDFGIDFDQEGLTSPDGLAQSEIKKAVISLPEGMTVNPSVAEGLGVCSAADLERETLESAPGEGCPNSSKIGTVEVETPLIDESVDGSVFLAEQYENPFNSLIAFYIVLRNENLGVLIKQPAKVEPDPRTGQLLTTVEDIPQVPFSHFRFHFREGQRSPLASPPACGTYATVARLTPWADPAGTLTTTSTFQITGGTNGAPCPPGGAPPFRPGFNAYSLNMAGGAFSPFYMRWTRSDGEQDITRFSAKLPPGMVAKLAGTTMCPDAGIASAKGKTGLAEIASPSCPASSRIGRVLAGAGVGAALTYVPGELYMAGPYKGAPLSVVAIVPAVAGPFDVGTVTTRQALRIDPRTAEVTADGASSDPIPHLLAGIPLKVRDVRVYVDRPDFTLNPTSCDPSEVGAQLWGGGLDVFSGADDTPVSLATRFQAAGCSSLGFRPRLSLKLKGGTERGGHPALTGTYTPRPGDANLSNLVLRLPRSAFLDQAHIRTICTRVQFVARSCPGGAVYGRATAYTPLLDEPLSGPVYLRSSDHNLPDFVADLRGLIDVEAVARIDSKNGGIRATFADVPDAPLSKVVVRMQGARKGLIVNSTNLCTAANRAAVTYSAHNGRRASGKPLMRAECGGGRHEKSKLRRGR